MTTLTVITQPSLVGDKVVAVRLPHQVTQYVRDPWFTGVPWTEHLRYMGLPVRKNNTLYGSDTKEKTKRTVVTEKVKVLSEALYSILESGTAYLTHVRVSGGEWEDRNQAQPDAWSFFSSDLEWMMLDTILEGIDRENGKVLEQTDKQLTVECAIEIYTWKEV